MHTVTAAGSGKGPRNIKRHSEQNQTKQPTDIEELVEEEKEEKNWKGIGITLLVIVIVFACVSLAVYLVAPDEPELREGDKLTFEEYVNGDYEPYIVEPRWSNDGNSFMYKTHDNELVFHECETNFSSIFLDSSPFNEHSTTEYLVSPDRSFVLFLDERKEISGQLSLLRYKVYDTDTRLSRDLIGPRSNEFQYVSWTNNGQGLVVVQNNNIYFKESFAVENSSYMQLTVSGKEQSIYNGVPDWLYAEEILKSDHALWLSPYDEYLLFAQFDDSSVHQMPFTKYSDGKEVYPERLQLRYPKAVTTNPKVVLKLYSFKNNMTVILRPPQDFQSRDHYLISAQWIDDKRFATVWLNRAQNISIICICDATKGSCYENLVVEATYGWVDMIRGLVFTTSGHFYFLPLPRQDSGGGLTKQVAMVDASVNVKAYSIKGKTLFVTAGDLEVVKVVGYFNESIYFIGIPLDNPRERHLYTTVIKDTMPIYNSTCISCDIGDHCKYLDAKFGVSGKFYVLQCLGPSVPSFSLYATTTGFITILEDNAALDHRLSEKLEPVDDFRNITLPGGNYILSKLILPGVLNKEELIQYNMVVVPNEDIGIQSVTEKFYIGWEHVLASLHNIIIVKLDTSGSTGRGELWHKAVYRNVASREVDEILASVRSLKELKYVHNVVGVIGKGYGGHLALLSLSSDFNNVISCGVVTAPVVDYSYLDSVTAERLYETPEYKIISHNDVKLLKNVKNMHRHKLLLLHGMLDDHIHFQHTAQYTRALVEENIDHNLQVYPDISYVLQDGRSKLHALSAIERFLIDCLELDPAADPTYYIDDDDEE